jgi:hypothetical protein
VLPLQAAYHGLGHTHLFGEGNLGEVGCSPDRGQVLGIGPVRLSRLGADDCDAVGLPGVTGTA